MIEPEFYITKTDSFSVRFPKEPAHRAWLLVEWLADGMIYAGDIDKFLNDFNLVEAGSPEIKRRVFAVRFYISKARVLLEQAYFPSPEEEANPATTELSFDEAKALILKWRDAQAAWEKNRSQSS